MCRRLNLILNGEEKNRQISSENSFLLEINLTLSQIYSEITPENLMLLKVKGVPNFDDCEDIFQNLNIFLAHI